MAHGLLWLPLLAVFFWLAWAGWNEYQKVEAYRVWAGNFDRAKYDIYSVLGQKGEELTWGLPTRQGPVNLETFSLKEVTFLQLLINDQPVALDATPGNGRAALEFRISDRSIRIPFTDSSLAAQWGQYLQRELQRLQLEPSS